MHHCKTTILTNKSEHLLSLITLLISNQKLHGNVLCEPFVKVWKMFHSILSVPNINQYSKGMKELFVCVCSKFDSSKCLLIR